MPDRSRLLDLVPGRPAPRLLAGHCLLAALCLLAACQDDSATTPFDAIPPSIDPDPAGITLPGDPARPALDAVVDMPQAPANPDDRDGLYLTSRLEAWIAPGATIGATNAALEANDARVLSMTTGVPLVTLVIAAVPDADALRARAEALQADPAFLMVLPAMSTNAPLAREAAAPMTAQERVAPANDSVPVHLETARSPGAWNARARALAVGASVPVLVADFFSVLTPHPEVPAMSFPAGVTGSATANENHGWHVAGTIAADFAGNSAVGIHPEGATLLDVQAIPMGGLTWSGMLQELLRRVPASGNFVISTSLGFGIDASVHGANGGNWTADQLMTGMAQAIAWRIALAGDTDRFIHATAAGNERAYAGTMNRAELVSPWTMAHRFDDLRDAFPAGLLNNVQQRTADSLWAATLTGNPEATVHLPNTIIVGSSDAAGIESGFSNTGPTLRAVGENVVNVCRATVGGCDGTYETMSGTSMATPQVAGMAAWVWNLRPQWTATQVRERLVAAYRSGVTDHYALTLSTDGGFADAPARRAVLDVAGSSASPGTNGRFDEADIELYLQLFRTFAELPGSGLQADHSRYDLNGDGYTDAGSASSGSPVDLDFDGLVIGTASYTVGGAAISVEEGLPTDLEVLCYYAFSPLFEGDASARDALLADCMPPGLEIVIEAWRDEVSVGGTDTLTFVVLQDGEPAPEVDVAVQATGGDAAPSTGVTDANGRFTSVLSFEPASTTMSVAISAGRAGSQPVDTTLTAVTSSPGALQPVSLGITLSASSYARARYDIERDSEPNITFSGEPVRALSETITTEADTANAYGSASASSSVSMDLTIEESSPGVTSGYVVNATASGATSISDDGSASASNEVSFYLEFAVVGDSVAYSFESTFDPAGDERGWTRFVGPFPESFDERDAPPGVPVSRSFSGTLGPGNYSIEFNFDRDVASNTISPDPVDVRATMNIAVRFGEGVGR